MIKTVGTAFLQAFGDQATSARARIHAMATARAPRYGADPQTRAPDVPTHRGSGCSLSAKLRVSTSVCFGRLHVIPHLPAFLADHPDLDVELVLDDRQVDLVNEGIDVALRMGPMPDSNMVARRIAEGRRVVVATPACLQRHGTPKSPVELAGHQAILYSGRPGWASWTFRKAEQMVSVELQARLKMTAAEGRREAVNRDLGFTIASERNFWPELKSGKVVALLEDWALPPIHLSAVYPTGRLASAKARAFVSFVEGSLVA